jgi:flagellar motility protein MotE (MotC chaperone)
MGKRGGMSNLLLFGAGMLGIAALVISLVDLPGLSVAAAHMPTTVAKDPNQEVSAQLTRREVSLMQAEETLKAREGMVKEKETQVSGLVKELAAQKAEGEQIKRMASVYAAMPPYKAGPLVQRLDLDLAAKVLLYLDQEEIAAIIAYMEPTTAAQVMAKLVH